MQMKSIFKNSFGITRCRRRKYFVLIKKKKTHRIRSERILQVLVR